MFGINATDDRPSSAVFAIAQFRLLEGRVNMLGLKALPMRLNVRAGTGYMTNRDQHTENCATWGLEPTVYLNRNWGIALRFDQDLQSFWSHGESVYRNHLGLGLNVAY